VHSGQADHGHYYSYINKSQHPERWIECNDSQVVEFDPSRLEEETFGGLEEVKLQAEARGRKGQWEKSKGEWETHSMETWRSAYLLFYRKISPLAVQKLLFYTHTHTHLHIFIFISIYFYIYKYTYIYL